MRCAPKEGVGSTPTVGNIFGYNLVPRTLNISHGRAPEVPGRAETSGSECIRQHVLCICKRTRATACDTQT